MYYVAVFLAGILLSSGLLLVKQTFFQLIERNFTLINVMLSASEHEDDVLQKLLIQRLGKVAASLLVFLFKLALVFFIAYLPILSFQTFMQESLSSFDTSSLTFWTVFIVGTAAPFIVFSLSGKKQDYSDLTKLFHRIILNNYALSSTLFDLEKRVYSGKLKNTDEKFIVVTGLARAGTTALTTQLSTSPKLYSLSYSNMPLLLSPNLWRLFYNPKQVRLRERSHGDRVLFGYNSVEALEEYFWKVMTYDSYISADHVAKNNVSEDAYSSYMAYQSLLRPKDQNARYLAKNNNFIVHLESLKRHNDQFIAIVMFRDPVEQAKSLLNQHLRYKKMQHDDPFILEYMNWLAHHEFGQNQKVFKLRKDDPEITGDDESLDYWIQIWINYYSYVLDLDLTQTILIDYTDYLEKPAATLKRISELIEIPLDYGNVKEFMGKSYQKENSKNQVIIEAESIYGRLQSIKENIS